MAPSRHLRAKMVSVHMTAADQTVQRKNSACHEAVHICLTGADAGQSSRSGGLYSPFRVALNGMRRRRQKFVEPLLYHRVAFTRCLFEALTIDDLYLPPAIANETGGLHRLRGKCHRFPVGTQHVSQKFVRV